MITALYGWARYRATADGITVSAEDFNAAIARVCESKQTDTDMDMVFGCLRDIFELSPEQNPSYQVFIEDKDGKQRRATENHMKFILQPKQSLLGKASQSIGGAKFASVFLRKDAEAVGGSYAKRDVETDKKQREGTPKTQKEHKAVIPEDKLGEFQRLRVIDTFFGAEEKKILPGGETRTCSFCGSDHCFNGVQFVPPLNLFVENVSNFTPFLSREVSHSICPYCAMLFMRTCIEGKAPERLVFRNTSQACIYVLPFDPTSPIPYESYSRQGAERLMRADFGDQEGSQGVFALDYLLRLPIIVHDALPTSTYHAIQPSLYIAFVAREENIEQIVDSAVITRLDYLARVGRRLKEGNWSRAVRDFERTLRSFVAKFRREQKVKGYKIIFRFLAELLASGRVDFAFLHRIVREEVCRTKREDHEPRLGDLHYLESFLEEAANG